MPLPDAGVDGPLDWAHLVDAAKAFEGKQTSCFQCLCCHLYTHQRKSLFFTFSIVEQRLAFLTAQEEDSTAEAMAAAIPQQAEPQAAPPRQPLPG